MRASDARAIAALSFLAFLLRVDVADLRKITGLPPDEKRRPIDTFIHSFKVYAGFLLFLCYCNLNYSNSNGKQQGQQLPKVDVVDDDDDDSNGVAR